MRQLVASVAPVVLLACTTLGCLEVTTQPDAGHAVSAELTACAAHAGSPVTSVAEVVGQINALPRPVGGPCLVASLPRPLSLIGTIGQVSAQPAGGRQAPRVFILNPGVVIAVVPGDPYDAGFGPKAIEMGQWVSANRTLKAEILLPVTDTLSVDEPTAHLAKDGGGTDCGMCHHTEAPNSTAAHGYDSAAYRPQLDDEVKLPALQALHQACVSSGEVSARCDMFHALFDFGAVEQGALASEVEYFMP